LARYREKDETDLIWNRIRRQLTRDLDTEIQNRREEVLNILLSTAWEDYTKAIATGDLKEVESRYTGFAKQVVDDALPVKDLLGGDVENS